MGEGSMGTVVAVVALVVLDDADTAADIDTADIDTADTDTAAVAVVGAALIVSDVHGRVASVDSL